MRSVESALSRSMIVGVRTRALRRGVWFRVLSRAERACMDLAVRVVEKVRSHLLHRVLCSLLVKLLEALESPVQRMTRVVGFNLAAGLSWTAQSWGHRSAVEWMTDVGFARFLAVTRMNGSCSFGDSS